MKAGTVCIVLVAIAALIWGCSKKPVDEGTSTAVQPMASKMDEDPHKDIKLEPGEDPVMLAKAHKDTQAAFEKNPKDEKAKAAYVDATVKLATATMMNPDLPATTKYKDALKLYRQALKLDPNNKEALANSDMIVSIYKQMGRPVPE